jgi:hypothetical protein
MSSISCSRAVNISSLGFNSVISRWWDDLQFGLQFGSQVLP